MPKQFSDLSFDFQTFKRQIEEYEDFLKKEELDEKRDIQPFFHARPLLSAQIGTFFSDLQIPDKIAFEYDIFGDFACDLAVGNTKINAFCFVEFEDAKKDSLFRLETKYKPSYGQRLEHGFSQILDWFCKIEALHGTQDVQDRFGAHKIEYSGLLIIGRNKFLNPSLRYRLNWRAANVQIASKKISIITFDDLLTILQMKLNTISRYRS